MAARSTGTSFETALAVTTGAAPASPPRPRPRPPPPGPAADVLLPHAAPTRAVVPAAMRMRDRMQARLNTVGSKLLDKHTYPCRIAGYGAVGHTIYRADVI